MQVAPVSAIDWTDSDHAALGDSFAADRFLLTLTGIFSSLTLALAAFGIFAVLAYTVARARVEIGVRQALGATRRNILGEIPRRATTLVGTGLAIGFALSLLTTRALAGLLYDVGTLDPIAFAAAAFVLIAVGLLAGALPARRAANVAPGVALRSDSDLHRKQARAQARFGLKMVRHLIEELLRELPGLWRRPPAGPMPEPPSRGAEPDVLAQDGWRCMAGGRDAVVADAGAYDFRKDELTEIAQGLAEGRAQGAALALVELNAEDHPDSFFIPVSLKAASGSPVLVTFEPRQPNVVDPDRIHGPVARSN